MLPGCVLCVYIAFRQSEQRQRELCVLSTWTGEITSCTALWLLLHTWCVFCTFPLIASVVQLGKVDICKFEEECEKNEISLDNIFTSTYVWHGQSQDFCSEFLFSGERHAQNITLYKSRQTSRNIATDKNKMSAKDKGVIVNGRMERKKYELQELLELSINIKRIVRLIKVSIFFHLVNKAMHFYWFSFC